MTGHATYADAVDALMTAVRLNAEQQRGPGAVATEAEILTFVHAGAARFQTHIVTAYAADVQPAVNLLHNAGRDPRELTEAVAGWLETLATRVRNLPTLLDEGAE